MTKAAMALAAALCVPAIAQDSGKAMFERACTKCHNLDATSRQRNTRERWAAIVDDMVSRGMEASDAEIERIIDYLAKTQGAKLNVNTAAAGELAGALNVPAATASAIIAYRTKNGPFKSFDELKRVPALDGKDIESKKANLDFSAPK